MSHSEDHLAQVERHAREGERHVAHLHDIIGQLEADGHPRAADRARTVLATIRRSLELARDHLRVERAARGIEP
ncbi:MAG: hypothetical protein IRY87_24305 [Acetobacteraceae bacterium]|nr:hypothetical protein [Acetobacteraceae bacterium]